MKHSGAGERQRDEGGERDERGEEEKLELELLFCRHKMMMTNEL